MAIDDIYHSCTIVIGVIFSNLASTSCEKSRPDLVLDIKGNMVIYWIYFLFQCVNWHYLKSAFVWRYGTPIWPLTSHHVLYESAPFAVCPDPRTEGPLMGPINGWHKNWISMIKMDAEKCEKWWLHQKYFSIPWFSFGWPCPHHDGWPMITW